MTEQQRCGSQVQAARAAAATKEATLMEERAALEARLHSSTAACTALETKVSGIPLTPASAHLHDTLSFREPWVVNHVLPSHRLWWHS